MEIARYVRWRLGPQGRAAYKGYAQGRAEAAALSAAPARPGHARAAGCAAGWQGPERPRRARGRR